jgi:osmotically-inducible protein OsmY
MVQNGVIILIGELGSVDARAAAGSRAWQVPGVVDVCNRITVDATEVDGTEAGLR